MSEKCYLCNTYPGTNTLSASERTNQKSAVQIRKNNILLNCNSSLSKTDWNRRVYSGIQNRLLSIHGYKLIQEKCNGTETCIFSEKKEIDYWINENSKNIIYNDIPQN